jgi:hypothetical protein
MLRSTIRIKVDFKLANLANESKYIQINKSIILCCESNNAIINGSVGNGWPLALIAAAYL